jgi:hypothetical protein
MERKKGTQLSSADANEGSAYFQPAACLGKKISVSDIDGLKIFKLYKHPEIRPQIEVMKTNCATLPAFAYVLRAVLTNSPNSCPPERLFSIFNSTYNDDQKKSHADYIQLSMQSQFNKREL